MHTNYNSMTPGVEYFLCDTVADIENIPVTELLPGSKVFVIADSTYYMLNHQKAWILITSNNSSGSGNGGDPTNNSYSVDGGVIL